MKRLALLLLAFSSLHAAEPGKAIRPDLLTDAYVPLVIIGEGWSQQIVIHNVDDEEAVTGTLNFFDAFGDPWDVNLVEQGRGDTFFVTLLPNQIAVYETVVSFGVQILGYAYIDLNCCPRSMIQTIFRRQEANRPDLMTSFPIGEDSFESVQIMFDNRGGKFAGVGILTTGFCFSFSCETVMDVILRDANGNVIVQERRTQQNGTLWWFSLSVEYPQVRGMVGSLEVKSDDPDSDFIRAVGFSLQFAPNGAFTAVTTAER